MATIKPLALLKETITKSITIVPAVVKGGKPDLLAIARSLPFRLKKLTRKLRGYWLTALLLLVVAAAGIYLITRDTVPGTSPGSDQEIAIEAVPGNNPPAPLPVQPNLAGSTTVPAANPAEKAALSTASMENLQVPVTGEIIKSFGFAFSPTFKDYRYHRGVDFRGVPGENVLATESGTVEQAIPGFRLVLNHGNGWVTNYEGIGDVKVVEGQQVNKGDILATVGAPPAAEAALGEHIHLEMSRDNQQVDPEKFFILR